MGSTSESGLGRRWQDLKGIALGPTIGVYNLFLFAVLERPPFIPTADFPFIADLEDNWKVIREELDELLEHGPEVPPFVMVDPGQKKLWEHTGKILRRIKPSADPDQLRLDSWRSFVFRTYGRDVPPNRELCPKTAAMLDEIPNMVGAMFSVLEPGASLPLHFGLFPGAYRVHLGLKVPPGGKTGMRVAGIDRSWEEGEAFMFEHSRFHTAWNDADEVRVVLIFDVERPMPWPWLSKLNHRFVESLRTWRRTRDAVAHIESLTKPSVSKVEPRMS